MLYLYWEVFRLENPANANIEQTQNKVNIYIIVSFPIWHGLSLKGLKQGNKKDKLQQGVKSVQSEIEFIPD